jgi:hypothetical protein
MGIQRGFGLVCAAACAALWAAGASASTHAAPGGVDLETAFAAADANGDGVVNVDEYVGYVVGRVDGMAHDPDGRLRPQDVPGVDMARFAAADRDGDGALSVGEVVAERMIVFFDADVNRDGVLTLDELRRYDAR